MRTRFVTSAWLAALLTSCSGASTPPVAGSGAASAIFARAYPAARPPAVPANRSGFVPHVPTDFPLVYVSLFFPPGSSDDTYVLGFIQHNVGNTGAVCKIDVPTLTVNGIGVDFQGNLWVPYGIGTGTGYTTEYGPRCGRARLTINDTSGQPGNVAFDPAGNVYIENIANTRGMGNGADVNVYAPGSQRRLRVLKEPRAQLGIGLALDKGGNVYVSWSDAKARGHVTEFPDGKGPAKTLPIASGFPGGLVFDKRGNMLLVDQLNRRLLIYAPPYDRHTLVATTLLQGIAYCKLNQRETQLYCGNYFKGAIDVYHYDPSKPANVRFRYSFSNSLQEAQTITGVALAPPAPN